MKCALTSKIQVDVCRGMLVIQQPVFPERKKKDCRKRLTISLDY